jgi:hypothetical protein
VCLPSFNISSRRVDFLEPLSPFLGRKHCTLVLGWRPRPPIAAAVVRSCTERESTLTSCFSLASLPSGGVCLLETCRMCVYGAAGLCVGDGRVVTHDARHQVEGGSASEWTALDIFPVARQSYYKHLVSNLNTPLLLLLTGVASQPASPHITASCHHHHPSSTSASSCSWPPPGPGVKILLDN